MEEILTISTTWGTSDATKATIPFHLARGAKQAGHEDGRADHQDEDAPQWSGQWCEPAAESIVHDVHLHAGNPHRGLAASATRCGPGRFRTVLTGFPL